MMNTTYFNKGMGVAFVSVLCSLSLGVIASADTVEGSGSVTAADPLPAGESAAVKLTLEGQTVVESTPTDIVFVIDGSGSLGATGFSQETAFVNSLIGGLSTAGLFANGGQAGAVIFSSDVTEQFPLTDNEAALTSDIAGAAYPQSFTCTFCGINAATAMLSASTAGNKVMVVLTDGQQLLAPEDRPLFDAEQELADAVAAAQGLATVFAVGFGGNIDTNELRLIASGPGNEGVFTAASAGSLGSILTELVEAVVLPGGTGIEVVATVAADFDVSGVSVTKGDLDMSGNVLTWTIDELAEEEACLSYSVTAPGECDLPAGETAIHDLITYADNEGNVVDFGSLTVTLEGDVTPPVIGHELVGPNANSGFFAIVASDNCDESVDVYINGFGPFADGDVVKVTVAPGAEPKQQDKKFWTHLILNEGATLSATDASGNTTEVDCPAPSNNAGGNGNGNGPKAK